MRGLLILRARCAAFLGRCTVDEKAMLYGVLSKGWYPERIGIDIGTAGEAALVDLWQHMEALEYAWAKDTERVEKD